MLMQNRRFLSHTRLALAQALLSNTASMNMNGITELATDQIATYSINSATASNECTNTIANEMLLDVMLHGEGEDVLVFFFDCCGLNRNVSELILTRSL